MFNKIFYIRKASNEEAIKKLKPIYEYKNNKRDPHDILNQRKLKQQNKFYLQKIGQKRSIYNNDQWRKDFTKSQFFKKNICLFPALADTKYKNKDIFNIKYKNYFDDVKFKDLRSFSQPRKKIFEQENEKNEIETNINCRNKKNINYTSANSTIKNKSNNSNNITFSDNKTDSIYKDDNIISLKFIMYNNNLREIGNIVHCNKKDLFSDVVDKLMKNQKNLNKNKIKGFTIKNNKNIIIDKNKTIEGNKLGNNANIIINI